MLLKVYSFVLLSKEIYKNIEPKLKELEKDTGTEITYDFMDQCFSITGHDSKGRRIAEDIICDSLLPYLGRYLDDYYIYGTFCDPDLTKSLPMINRKVINMNTVIGRSPIIDKDNDIIILDDHISESSNDDQDSQEYITKVFFISPSIPNRNSFLIGPPQHNMINAEYLQIIPKKLDITCELVDRNIYISGEKRKVEQAYDMFSVIQKTVLGRSKTLMVSCIHYPEASEKYELYFCNLKNYKYKSLVYKQLKKKEDRKSMYVLLPIFKELHQYKQPKDLLSVDEFMQHSTQFHLRRMLNYAQFTMINKSGFHANHNKYNHDNVTILNHEDVNDFCFTPIFSRKSITDENSDCITNKGIVKTTLHERFTTTCPNSPNITKKSTRQLGINKNTASILSQNTSLVERVKTYNYQNIKYVLKNALESIRGFKGEIKLSSRLGKVLWQFDNKDITHDIWNIQHINEIIIGEFKNFPKFSSMCTKDAEIIDQITSEKVLPCEPYSQSAMYEFHCSARNKPNAHFKPIVLYVTQRGLKLQKVTISERSVAEINWTVLDRKFDFQLNLITREHVRTDVKPYTSFMKWLTICPNTDIMSFENVPGFLHVNFLIFKTTTRYKIVHPFIIEIIRSEKVPLKSVNKTNKIDAYVDEGECWYEFHIYNVMLNDIFQQNFKLDIGREASWKVEDILMTDIDDTIVHIVRNSLDAIEKIEQTFKRNTKK